MPMIGNVHSIRGNFAFGPKCKAKLLSLARNNRAVAAIEAAIVMPLILLIGFGGMELANYVMTHSRLSQAALGVADNASRIGGITGRVRESDVQEVFVGAQLQTDGLDWENRGRIILSSLEERTVDNVKRQKIRWQRCMGGLAVNSAYGAAGKDLGLSNDSSSGMGPTGNKLKVSGDTAIMFVELFYDYRPMVMSNIIGTQRMQYTAAFNIREARDLEGGTEGVYGPALATPLTC